MKLISLKKNKGASAVSGLMIFLALLIVVNVVVELYILYTVSAKVKDAVERSIRDITTLNEVNIYSGLRENYFQLTADQIASLITIDELKDHLSEELGLTKRSDGSLYKVGKQGRYNYKIRDITVNSVYYDGTNTLCFEAEGKVDVPVAVFAYVIPDISINFDVRSMYSSKMRATDILGETES